MAAIRDGVNACLRSNDPEGDPGAIFSLAKLCQNGYSRQVLEEVKKPLKDHTNPGAQYKMLMLLEQLATNGCWAFRNNLSTDKWMNRLIEIAKRTENTAIKEKIPQMIVNWDYLYQKEGHFGFRTFGTSLLQGSRSLKYPAPSVVAAQSFGQSRPQAGYSTQPPSVVQPLSSSFNSASSSVSGSVKAPVSAGYGTKTSASAGSRPHSPNTGMGLRMNRDQIERFLMTVNDNLDEFNSELEILLQGIGGIEAREDFPLYKTLQENAIRIEECRGQGNHTYDLTEALEKASDNVGWALKLYRDYLQSQKPVDDSPADGKTLNPSAMISGASMNQAIEELERLRVELRQKDENEQRLTREVDRLTGENELLRSQGGGGGGGDSTIVPVVAAISTSGEKIPPKVVAALRCHKKQSEIAINRARGFKNEIKDKYREFMEHMDSNFTQCIDKMAIIAKRPNNEALIKKLQEDYLKEMRLRKQYYNKIQELRGNIRVFCRVRPLNNKEITEHKAVNVCNYKDDDEIVISDENARTKHKKFDFDRVYNPSESQEAVFKDTSPLIESVIDGYNVCIFAYGQTGSGKTYTMEGPPENPGVNTRALTRLFDIIEEKRESESITVRLSILEIYNEKIKDLLVEPAVVAKTSYEVKTGGDTGNYVSNLTTQDVTSLHDIERWGAIAHKNRSQAKTSMNEHSSRSHMLLYFVVRTENIATGNKCYGKLSLIDLAGSERLKKSHAEGQAAEEAKFINKSLSALGETIAALSGNSKHIPFRNSKLTFLLQDSLSGNSKVLMFANISPADYNTTETISTLNFADKARNTALGMATKNKGN